MHTSYESDSRPLGGPLNGYSSQSSMTCSAGGYSNQRFTGSIPSPSPLRSSMSSDGSMGLLSRSPAKTSLSRTNGRSGSHYRYPANQDEVLFKQWFVLDIQKVTRFASVSNTTIGDLKNRAKTLHLRIWKSSRSRTPGLQDRIAFGIATQAMRVITDHSQTKTVTKCLFSWGLHQETNSMQPGKHESVSMPYTRPTH